MDEKIKRKCQVCNNFVMTDIFGQGECDFCKWFNNSFAEEDPNEVNFPNLVSLNKAKQLFKEGKEFRPDLSDFLAGFDYYGEMVFYYNGIECCLFRSNNEDGIEFSRSDNNTTYFSDKEDFIQNAKIGDEYVRDIWDKVIDPSYM